jgi:hypothetical protein
MRYNDTAFNKGWHTVADGTACALQMIPPLISCQFTAHNSLLCKRKRNWCTGHVTQIPPLSHRKIWFTWKRSPAAEAEPPAAERRGRVPADGPASDSAAAPPPSRSCCARCMVTIVELP